MYKFLDVHIQLLNFLVNIYHFFFIYFIRVQYHVWLLGCL